MQQALCTEETRRAPSLLCSFGKTIAMASTIVTTATNSLAFPPATSGYTALSDFKFPARPGASKSLKRGCTGSRARGPSPRTQPSQPSGYGVRIRLRPGASARRPSLRRRATWGPVARATGTVTVADTVTAADRWPCDGSLDSESSKPRRTHGSV